MEEEDIAAMPPFPFPQKLFPPGTFPKARDVPSADGSARAFRTRPPRP